MKHLRNIRIVTLFELSTILKRPAIIGAILVPPLLATLLTWFFFWAIEFVIDDEEASPEDPLPIAIVDDTRQIKTYDAPYFSLFIHAPDTKSAQLMYEQGDIQGYYHIPATYPYDNEITYYTSETANDDEAYYGLKYILADNLLHYSTPPELVIDPLDNQIEVNVGAGETKATANTAIIKGWLGYILGVLIWLTITIGAGLLVNGLDQEKENRMLEIILISIHPLELLIGKLIGLGIVAMLHTISWVLIGGGMAWLLFETPADFEWPVFAWGQLLVIPIVTLTGYIMYSTLFATASAMTPNAKESAKYTALINMPLMLTLFTWPILIINPTGRLAIFFTLIPLTSPIILPLRATIVPVPAWQWLVSLGSMFIIIVVMMWFASKVLRMRVLLAGQSISLGMIWQILREK